MATSAKANESQHAYVTAIADGEEILSSHIVEANTSHCVTEVMSLKSSNERRKRQKATVYCPSRPCPSPFPIGLYGRKCL